MDLLDKRIICELDKNCRVSLSHMAKTLRTNRNVLAYRIKKLEDKGVIKNYICSINLGKLGYKTYKIQLKTWSGKRSEIDFVETVKKDKQIISFLKTEGSFDYSISIAVKSITELDNFLMELKTKFKDLIKDYHISIVVYSKVFKATKFLLDEKQPIPKFERYSGEDTLVKIDDKDKRILRELAQNSNLSIVELAKKTRLSIDIVKYRLKNLSKDLINSYRAMININQLGYYPYVFLLRIKQATKKDEARLVSWCALKMNVLFCTKRIGYYDFAINVAIKDIDDFNSFLAELKSKFGEMIESSETLINSKILKLNYVPF